MKSHKIACVFLFFLFTIHCSLFTAVYAAESASRSSLEAKLALENSLEKRVQMVLSEALGTDDVIVIISAELQAEEQKKPLLEFLPGIPEKEKVGEMSLSNSLTMVKRISATVILDKNTSEEDIKLAKKLTAGLLGIPSDNENLITIEEMSFRKTKPFILNDMLTDATAAFLLIYPCFRRGRHQPLHSQTVMPPDHIRRIFLS